MPRATKPKRYPKTIVMDPVIIRALEIQTEAKGGVFSDHIEQAVRAALPRKILRQASKEVRNG